MSFDEFFDKHMRLRRESDRANGWIFVRVAPGIEIQVHPDRDCTHSLCHKRIHRHMKIELTLGGKDVHDK